MENYLLSPLIYAEVKPKSIFLGIYEKNSIVHLTISFFKTWFIRKDTKNIVYPVSVLISDLQ